MVLITVSKPSSFVPFVKATVTWTLNDPMFVEATGLDKPTLVSTSLSTANVLGHVMVTAGGATVILVSSELKVLVVVSYVDDLPPNSTI